MMKRDLNIPTMIVFGGVNGAGKTCLFEVMKTTEELGERVNVDDIVKSRGSWQDTLLQVRAAKIAKDRISAYIKNKTPFHFESTLTGMSVLRQLESAKKNGFHTILYFVGIDGFETAIERVHHRMEHGGHGIEERAIIARYKAMPNNLRRILPHCDEAYFYDNTVRFRQIAIHRGGDILDEDPILPDWYQGIFTGHTLSNPYFG